jgi:hypothetical protein
LLEHVVVLVAAYNKSETTGLQVEVFGTLCAMNVLAELAAVAVGTVATILKVKGASVIAFLLSKWLVQDTKIAIKCFICLLFCSLILMLKRCA